MLAISVMGLLNSGMENPYLAPKAEPSPPPLPVVEKTPWNMWWTLLWGVTLFFAWQTVQGIGMVIYMFKEGIFEEIAKKKGQISNEDIMALVMDGDLLGTLAFVSIFAVCPLAWIIGKVKKPWGGCEYLGNAAVRWWKWPLWLAATFLLAFGFGLIGPYLGIDEMHESMVQMATSTEYPILLFLGVAIGAPLVEEFIFRGVLFRGWRGKTNVGLWVTLILTSFLWAILHVQYEIEIIAFIFILGILLGLARELTGNLWVPVAMHALNNGISVIVMLTTDFRA